MTVKGRPQVSEFSPSRRHTVANHFPAEDTCPSVGPIVHRQGSRRSTIDARSTNAIEDARRKIIAARCNHCIPRDENEAESATAIENETPHHASRPANGINLLIRIDAIVIGLGQGLEQEVTPLFRRYTDDGRGVRRNRSPSPSRMDADSAIHKIAFSRSTGETTESTILGQRINK